MRVGKNIQAICGALEALGPSGAKALRPYLPTTDPANISKYLSRAVGLGLVTVVHGERHRASFSVYTAVVGWQHIAVPGRKKADNPEFMCLEVLPTRWQGVNSVFNMAR